MSRGSWRAQLRSDLGKNCLRGKKSLPLIFALIAVKHTCILSKPFVWLCSLIKYFICISFRFLFSPSFAIRMDLCRRETVQWATERLCMPAGLIDDSRKSFDVTAGNLFTNAAAFCFQSQSSMFSKQFIYIFYSVQCWQKALRQLRCLYWKGVWRQSFVLLFKNCL